MGKFSNGFLRQFSKAKTIFIGAKTYAEDKINEVSGRDVDAHLTAYSTTYGEILLGMDRDLQRQNAAIDRQNEVVEQYRSEMTALVETAQANREEVVALHTDTARLLDETRLLTEQAQAAVASVNRIKEELVRLDGSQRRRHTMLLVLVGASFVLSLAALIASR